MAMIPYAAGYWVAHALVEDVVSRTCDGTKCLFGLDKLYIVLQCVSSCTVSTTPPFALKSGLQNNLGQCHCTMLPRVLMN